MAVDVGINIVVRFATAKRVDERRRSRVCAVAGPCVHKWKNMLGHDVMGKMLLCWNSLL